MTSDIYRLLDEIRARPSMFVRFDSPERRLDDLQFLLFGYEIADIERHGPDIGGSFLRDFGSFVRRKHGWSMSAGVIGAIRSHCPSDDEAWVTFWSLLDEYRRTT